MAPKTEKLSPTTVNSRNARQHSRLRWRGSVGPRFWAIGRVSDNRASYVWARAFWNASTQLRGEIGCIINGVETIWKTNIPLTWSLDMTFLCGANGNPRSYQVYSGTSLVSSYEEGFVNLAGFPSPGTTGRLYVANDTGLRYTWNGSAYVSSGSSASLLGDDTATSNYRRWGAITEIKVISGNLKDGGAVAAAVTNDNAVSAYKGSVARMVRAAAGNTGTINTTDTAVPTSFFDATPFETLDIDADHTNGTFTVTKSKMYLVTARIKLSTYLDANGYLGLQVWNGSTWSLSQIGPSIWGADTGSFSIAPSSGFALFGTWLQYLTEGQKVRLSIRVDRGSRATALTGDSNGAETYFSISALQ